MKEKLKTIKLNLKEVEALNFVINDIVAHASLIKDESGLTDEDDKFYIYKSELNGQESNLFGLTGESLSGLKSAVSKLDSQYCGG